MLNFTQNFMNFESLQESSKILEISTFLVKGTHNIFHFYFPLVPSQQYMARRIKCAYEAAVYISVTAAECWSGSTNHFRYYPLFEDWSSVGTSDGYLGLSCFCIAFNLL